MYTVWTYAAYLAVSTALTVWVARTLSRNGQIFLVEAFDHNEPLASSVNHLLVVGFYLINIGYVTLALSYGVKPNDLQSAIEFLSWKVGLVLVVLGFMHFFNLGVFSSMRRRATTRAERIGMARTARMASQASGVPGGLESNSALIPLE